MIDGQPRIARGVAKIVRFADTPAFPHAVADLSAVYAGQAKSVHRGIALLPSGEVWIRDRLTGLRPGAHVRWAMITRSTPRPGSGATAELRQGEARLTLHAVLPSGIAWRTVDCTTPAHEWDTPNRGTTMLVFEAVAPASGVLDLGVLATPGTCHDSRLDSLPVPMPLS